MKKPTQKKFKGSVLHLLMILKSADCVSQSSIYKFLFVHFFVESY